MELVLLVGLQGSGKSHFYRERFAGTHVHVSKDLWPNARRREARQRRLIGEALASGRSVVVDNTNPGVEERAPLIAIAREHGARVVGYAFESRLADCLARNAARAGRARVPEVALYATLKRLRWPRYEEGFDALYAVRIRPRGGFEVRQWGGQATSGSRRSPAQAATRTGTSSAGRETLTQQGASHHLRARGGAARPPGEGMALALGDKD